MPIHEALQHLDPHDQTPHDLYGILIYSAAAHPDVAQLMDRLARRRKDMFAPEREMNEQRVAMRLEPHFVPVIPFTPQTRRPGRPHGAARPKEVIEAEKAAKAAKRAEREASRAARKESQQKKQAEAARRKLDKAVKDKDFTSLVSRVKEELRCAEENSPKRQWSRKKQTQHRQNKAVEVETKLNWYQAQILQDMVEPERQVGTSEGVALHHVTFGTKKNALFSMKEIMSLVSSVKGHVGAHLRGDWFAGKLEQFKTAVNLLSPEESAMLRKDKKWIKELRSLVTAFRAKGIMTEASEEILLWIDIGAMAGAGSSDEEDGGSDGSDRSDESEESLEESLERLEGASVVDQVREEVSSEQSDDPELESSDIG